VHITWHGNLWSGRICDFPLFKDDSLRCSLQSGREEVIERMEILYMQGFEVRVYRGRNGYIMTIEELPEMKMKK
jgi:hypothetical protein